MDRQPVTYRRRPRRRANRVLYGVTLILLAVLVSYPMAALMTRVTPAVLPGAGFFPPATLLLESLPESLRVTSPGPDHVFNRPITILVTGVDLRPGESELLTRTDTIAVLRLDPVTHRATVLSVPRDLWVRIEDSAGGAYSERINASFPIGAEAGGSVEAGIRQLRGDLARNFGIEAEHFVWIDIGRAGEVIDLFGGVTVDVPEYLAVPEWLYTEDDRTDPRYVEIPPGRQHISGYEAVAFSRYREDSDLLRVERQQLVFRALLERGLSPRLLLNPVGALRAATNLVQSDLGAARLAGLLLLAGRSADDLALYSLGEPVEGTPTVFPIVTEAGAQVLDWDAANVNHWVTLAASTR